MPCNPLLSKMGLKCYIKLTMELNIMVSNQYLMKGYQNPYALLQLIKRISVTRRVAILEKPRKKICNS